MHFKICLNFPLKFVPTSEENHQPSKTFFPFRPSRAISQCEQNALKVFNFMSNFTKMFPQQNDAHEKFILTKQLPLFLFLRQVSNGLGFGDNNLHLVLSHTTQYTNFTPNRSTIQNNLPLTLHPLFMHETTSDKL